MATLTPLWTGEKITTAEEIRPLLQSEGIDFAVWDLPEEVRSLASADKLTDSDMNRLLEVFREEIAEVSEAKGYVDADVVAIRPGLDGLDAALAKFDKVHFHDDDEVRAIVGGSGVFGFVMRDGRQFLLEVVAGDYISVPAGMWHWFYCTEDRNITALRLFKDKSGWLPHYRNVSRGNHRLT